VALSWFIFAPLPALVEEQLLQFAQRLGLRGAFNRLLGDVRNLLISNSAQRLNGTGG
jgi:hypothetical protein